MAERENENDLASGHGARGDATRREQDMELFEASLSTSHATNNREPTKEDPVLDLAKKEDKAVWVLRLVVFFLLASVALAVCLLVYFSTKSSLQDDFETDFHKLADKLVRGFETSVHQQFAIIGNLATDITAYAKNQNKSFPFVTLPDYNVRAGELAEIAGLATLVLFPMVEETDRKDYEAYTVANQGWKADACTAELGLSPEELGPMPPIASRIMNLTRQPTVDEAPFFPIWQIHPCVKLPIQNTDLFHTPLYFGPISHALHNHQPAMSASFGFWDNPNATDWRLQTFRDIPAMQYQDDPVLPAFQPVFDDFYDDGDEDAKVKAVLLGGVYWRDQFQRILPEGDNGIVVVLENTCDQVFSYQVDGQDAAFLGPGDLHDTKYDYLEVGIEVVVHGRGGKETMKMFAGVCQYSIRVYPSEIFQDSYISNQPLYLSLSLAAVFILTSACFLVYDFCVERRQRKVMKSAQQSGAVVASLFPEAVRSKLYEELHQERESKVGRQHSDWKDRSNEPKSSSLTMEPKASVNAHLYAECTVFFADIAGFTHWTSSRSPEDVFDLLESIYGAFDASARRRSVFKIETIGDCYVASTGIPNAQKDHAVRMAKFANDCLSIFHALVQTELSERLGVDTAELGLRVGLHSGSVTAGVLRGEKARFQVFGDTVNTAARCESTGVPNRIQVSEVTAALIRDAGKGGWLKAREDLVEAKGKGKLQTYWLNTSNSDARSVNTIGTNQSGDVFGDEIETAPTQSA
ncbi:Receptor-type guanylate cyclase gcy [Seminavis robusta]|uniref:Receptor-type guanylate cyclase gcy n=1 Tax=Seminavis robusta TaxID=568900 RepID=A0A9N8DRA2_9STRA|nr:Receptor-type guanylate cyclase gcy [Seminavis robusta]|eukprot:Sro282_g107610.1 Receptor-type guanylate cyclase gcy (749) ;mRNA; f:74544-76950